MSPIDDDPLMQLLASGKDLWADEHADEYIHHLREGWDDRTAWEIVEDQARMRRTAEDSISESEDHENCKPPSGN